MRADNSSHLIEAAQQRRLQCIARVRTALGDMERDGGPVTIAGVAARAKVSRTFLYDHAQAPLLERLRAVCQVPGLMETIKPGGTSMVAPRKYPEELRERSIRMTLDARQEPASRPARAGGSVSSWGSTRRRYAVG